MTVADELQQITLTLVRRLRAESAAKAPTFSQLTVMMRLQARSMTTAELARAELVTPQSMGMLLAELEAAGLVARTADSSDARRRLVSLTAIGAHLLATTGRQAWLDEKLTAAEQKLLLDLLKRLGT